MKWAKIFGSGAFLLSVSSVLSRALGVLRDVLFSAHFGLGTGGGVSTLDAYYAAFRIPDFLYTLLILGAMSAAFIPLYTQIQQKEDPLQADRFASQVLFLLGLALLIFSSLIFVCAPFLTQWFFPAFSLELQGLTADLTRIMLLSPIFLGLSSVLQGIENSHERFLGMALAPLFYNGSILLATVLFADAWGVYALAWGVSVGAVLHFLVQIPGILKTRFRFQIRLPLLKKELRTFFFLTLPRLGGLALSQVSLLVDTFLATLIGVGSLSAYQYALNLQSFPYGVVAISASVAAFTALSRLAADQKKEEFLLRLKQTLENILFWVMPAIALIFFLRVEIIQFLLQRGEFSSSDTLFTASLLAFLSWAAFSQSLVPLFARAFYALQNTKVPFFVALGTLILNVSFNLLLIFIFDWDVRALALSTLASQSLGALTLMIFFARQMKISFWVLWPKSFPAQILGVGLMGLFIAGIQMLELGAFWTLLIGAPVALLLYFVVAYRVKTSKVSPLSSS